MSTEETAGVTSGKIDVHPTTHPLTAADAAATSADAPDATAPEAAAPDAGAPSAAALAPNLDALTTALREFAAERDWEQFHTPKNLAMALAGEAGELVAEFQWLTAAQSADLNTEQHQAVAEEMADVLIYLCRLADVTGIDLLHAAAAKLESNRTRYTVNTAKGNAQKVAKS